MKRIVVTGVGGFIARKVAEKLVDLGNIVIGVDDFSSGYRESLEFLDELISIDLSDKSAVKQLPISAIIFCIWLVSHPERSVLMIL